MMICLRELNYTKRIPSFKKRSARIPLYLLPVLILNKLRYSWNSQNSLVFLANGKVAVVFLLIPPLGIGPAKPELECFVL